MISGIVLAAGAAERMGRQKLLLDLRGKPVLQWSLEAALDSDLDEVLCVTKPANAIKPQIPLEHEKLRWVSNESAAEGQSTSVIAGLRAVSRRSEGAMFLVGDQPMMKPELIDALIDLFRQSAALIVAPAFGGEARNPVLFRRELFSELEKLTGDRGGKGLIEKFRDQAALLDWRDEEPFLDLDRWEDYVKLKR